MSTPAIPAGYHTVTPYLAIKNAVEALEFYKTAFGAIETFKLMMPDGRLGHAEIRLGDSMIMFSDEFPEYRWRRLAEGTGRLVSLYPLIRRGCGRVLQAGARCRCQGA